MPKKYTTILGTECHEIKVLARAKYGLTRIEYKIKHGRKLHHAWVSPAELAKVK